MIWRFTSNLSLKFLLGTGFRTPTAWELFNKSNARKANPDLKPERMRSVEFGLGYRFLNKYFDNATIMFTDFKGFTQIAEGLTAYELIKELDGCFSQFDKIIERNNLEKLKTIGDAYMCAGGLPTVNTTHPINSCLAALEIQSFMNQMKEIKQMMGSPYWELRLGIHSGSVMAGVVEEKKFAYDIWGDTVNTASRMESSGTPGRINISYATYEFVKDFFDCEYRGEVDAKNKGKVKMYYLNKIKQGAGNTYLSLSF